MYCRARELTHESWFFRKGSLTLGLYASAAQIAAHSNKLFASVSYRLYDGSGSSIQTRISELGFLLHFRLSSTSPHNVKHRNRTQSWERKQNCTLDCTGQLTPELVTEKSTLPSLTHSSLSSTTASIPAVRIQPGKVPLTKS